MKVETTLAAAAPESAEDAKLVQAAEQFEALFYNELFKAMRQTVPETPGQTFGTSMFTGMLDEQLAQNAASTGGLGLAKLVLQELREKSPQEVSKAVDTVKEKPTQVRYP